MFGPFGPGDSLRIYRLQRRGISLDLQRGLMQSQTPLWEAWLSFLTQQAMGQPTYVLYDPHDGEAFIQARYRPHQAAADVAFLAPSLAEHQRAANAWVRLLDGACVEAAGQGIQRVFANLPAGGDEVDAFHQASFTLYAEEDVYSLTPQEDGQQHESLPELRPQRPEDWPALQKLCVAITPQRVRQAEGGISLAARREKNCQRYVLPSPDGRDLVAALTICSGRLAHWLWLLVHPDARDLVEGSSSGLAKVVLNQGLAILTDQPGKQIYSTVRQYENGVRQALEEKGFEPFSTRALMVKHTLAWIKTPLQDVVPTLKSGAEPVPPTYRMDGEPGLTSPNGPLVAEAQSE